MYLKPIYKNSQCSSLTQYQSCVEHILWRFHFWENTVEIIYKPHNSLLEPFIFFLESADFSIDKEYIIDLLKCSNPDKMAINFRDAVTPLSLVSTETRPACFIRTSWIIVDGCFINKLRSVKTDLLSTHKTDIMHVVILQETRLVTVKRVSKKIEFWIKKLLTLENFFRNIS